MLSKKVSNSCERWRTDIKVAMYWRRGTERIPGVRVRVRVRVRCREHTWGYVVHTDAVLQGPFGGR